MFFDIESRRKYLRNRLLFWVWLVSSVITFFLTTIQLFSDYNKEEVQAFEQISVIKKNYIPSINKSLWDYNSSYLELQLSSLKNLPYVKSVNLISDDYHSGTKADDFNDLEVFKIPLSHKGQNIGTLQVGLDIYGIQQSYFYKSIQIFLLQALKTLIVCFMLLRIFESIIMKHVVKISQFLQRFDLNSEEKLSLDRSDQINDELTMLTSSINSLKGQLSVTRKELLQLNSELEKKVEERTNLLEEERARSLQSAKLASLGEMAGGIAHEINNPLAIISSSLLLLRKSMEKKYLTDELLVQSITTMEATVLRTSKIITGLRTVAHQSEKMEKTHVKAKDILDDVLGLCSEKFKSHGVDIRVSSEEYFYDRILYCDRVQFSQVLLNLFGNAFDAINSLETKWIKIELELDGEFDIVRVTDSGNGIPSEIVEKMFNPFFTSKEVGKGTGLGLSISKSIMAKHKGSIEVDNLSENTSFILKLPKAA